MVSGCYDTKPARTVEPNGGSALLSGTPTRRLDEMRVEQAEAGGSWTAA